MTMLLAVFLALVPARVHAFCSLSDNAARDYRALYVDSCAESPSGRCVYVLPTRGQSFREFLADEWCDSPSFATCTYKSPSFRVRAYWPCQVGHAPNCNVIFNVYSADGSENLASCQDE